MRFGFLLLARDLHAVGPLVQLGEQLGFDLIGLADSPAVAYDPYVALTLAALQTTRVRLGPAVTNPQTRHPLILAGLAASLERLAPSRSFLGLGTGNSGVRHAGAGPATLKTLAGAVELTRRLLAGESVELDGATLSVRHEGSPVPILLAASGPNSLRLAGRIADIVFIALGAAPEFVSEGLRWVQEGAEAAGRDPATLECWAYVDAVIAPERSQALEAVRGAAVARAAIVFRGPAVERLPPTLRGKMEQLVREYDYGQHFMPGRSANVRLAESLGVVDDLLERFAIAGTPDDCRRKVDSLREIGIGNICLNPTTAPDLASCLRLVRQEVLPAFNGAGFDVQRSTLDAGGLEP